MKTAVCSMLDIELPIFAFSHCRDVVAEVSRAGGMGVLGIAGFTPERLEEELAWIDAHCAGKPYGVDILIPNRYEKRAAMASAELLKMIPDEHRQFLDQLCAEGGIAPLPAGEAERMMQVEAERTNMTPESSMRLLEVVFKHPVKLLVNALGTPPRDMVEMLHERGLKVGSLVGALEHAKAQVEAGVDVLIAQGCEAGGHTGKVTSMVLWPQIVDAVAPIPVLAAGGIGRGRQMAAALALGAEGVWCGSIWLGTDKSDLSPDMKARMFSARAEDAIQSRSLTGKPCRMLRSKYSDAWEQPGAPKALPMPLQTIATQGARMRIERSRATEYMSYPVGQIVGDMHEESTVREVVYTILEEFIEATERLGGLLRDE
ncbi:MULTISPECIES: nitronate monooxygenase [Pseudomonas]|uniref:nitronate monooxygenase n=1 Tax=Pseudomonas nitroreducens TaxID=46680 RepID=UPI001E364C1D|nr:MULTISPECIES: nitronate monooxygenase [Pseudomonas]MCE4071516.1 nitronate monooxygenase [Pseudomonas nitritireducens]MCE4081292.1 nitronate monooxygenase [Pseudomonas nitroreducens]